MIPRLAMTYVVRFRDLDGIEVVKVGRAWKMSRLRSLLRAGAQVLMLLDHTPPEVERALLRVFRRDYMRAFDSEADARWLLPGGRGFTECFIVGETADTDWAAVRAAIGEGLRRGYDEAAEAGRGDVEASPVAASAAAGAAHVDRVDGGGGRRGQGSGGAEAAVGGHLPAGRDGDGGRPAGPRAAAGRGRVLVGVHGGRRGLLRDHRLADGGPAETVGDPAGAASRSSRDGIARLSRSSRGSRGREQGEGERGSRGSAGRRRPRGARPARPDRRTGSVLPCSPRGNQRALQAVRDCAPAALEVLAAGPRGRGSTGRRRPVVTSRRALTPSTTTTPRRDR